MTRSLKIIIVIAVAAPIGAALVLARTRKSLSYDAYVCTMCGMKREEGKRWIGPIRYRDRVTLEETPLSLALKVKNCPHPSWLMYRWSFDSGTVLGGRESFADGGTRSFMLEMLLIDDRLDVELARMERPSSVLKDLLVGLDNNRKLDESLETWWEDSDRSPFADWWKTNQPIVQAALPHTNR